MSTNGKRDVLRSIDYLLYCHMAYSYLLDKSLLVLLFRLLLQLQLLSPKALTRSIRTALLIVISGWLICVLLHLAIDPGQPGIIIDFIDNQQIPSTFRLLMLDFVVLLLQTVRALVTSSLSSQLLLHGTVVTTLPVPPAIATAFGADTITVMLPSRDRRLGDGSDTTEELLYHNDLVVDIGLRSCIRNIMYAEIENSNSARDGSDSLPV
ncbi:hypothetical protein RMATCC62417_04775 [Rhizopus microsporus]|nr:hypothetical protein RMATCC62417_04775 [Rhizopus microsporus]CEI98900.1 hypothetical protein RMCBS344292_12996 [Rhizopus microsporus]